MAAISFTVPGPVRGKGRPRFANGRTYTDGQTAAYENLVALAAREAMRGAQPFAEPVGMRMVFRVTPPKSASRVGRARMLLGAERPAKRPDLDNCVKAVVDGCNAVAFTDDALIVRLAAEKVYAETPGVDVLIAPVREAR
jgi:Holliday junction resolvase RusA-like endonuclease